MKYQIRLLISYRIFVIFFFFFLLFVYFFFFFQAEDGIRDKLVTGVQTCALPICESNWTLILNKKNEQWGAYFYKEADDVLRFDVKPEAIEATEWFDIDALPLSDRAMRIDISWEKLRIPFTIEFDTAALVWKHIDDALASPDVKWSDFLTAARYTM